MLVIVFAFRITDEGAYRTWIAGEIGLVELATPVMSFIGAYIGARLFAAEWRRGALRSLRTAWIAALTLACIYLGGEELAGGQQLVGWQTPEYIGEINDQNETNIHNMSSWFNQKPRLLLEI